MTSKAEIIDILDEMKDSRLLNVEITQNELCCFDFYVKNMLWRIEIFNSSVTIVRIMGNREKHREVTAEFDFKAKFASNNKPFFNGRIENKFERFKKACYKFKEKNWTKFEESIDIEIKITIRNMRSVNQYLNHYLKKLCFDENSFVLFLIEEKKIRLNKQFLSMHSPVFDTMFNSNFIEKDEVEIPIKDVALKSFLAFLRLLHYQHIFTNDEALIPEISIIADRYQIQWIIDVCESFEKSSENNDCDCNHQKSLKKDRVTISFDVKNVSDIHIPGTPLYDDEIVDILDEMKDSRVLKVVDYYPHSLLTSKGYVKNVFWKIHIGGKETTLSLWTRKKELNFSIVIGVQIKISSGEDGWGHLNRITLNSQETTAKVLENGIVFRFTSVPRIGLSLVKEMKLNVVKTMNLDRFPNHFLQQFPTDEASTVILSINGKRTRVNRRLLSMYSPIFDEMLNTEKYNSKEIRIARWDFESFMEFLRILHYRSTCNTSRTMMRNVWKIARCYQVQFVEEYCENWLLQKCQKLLEVKKEMIKKEFDCEFSGKNVEVISCKWLKEEIHHRLVSLCRIDSTLHEFDWNFPL